MCKLSLMTVTNVVNVSVNLIFLSGSAHTVLMHSAINVHCLCVLLCVCHNQLFCQIAKLRNCEFIVFHQ